MVRESGNVTSFIVEASEYPDLVQNYQVSGGRAGSCTLTSGPE
jgi:hypothetical protein